MTVTDTRRAKCPLCSKEREQILFLVNGETYKGWCCAQHLAAIVEQAKPKEQS